MKPDLTCLTTIAIACLPVSAALAQCVPAPGGLVSWLAGEGNIKDSIGANNGVLVNGAAFATGKVGQAFTFDGATGYVKIPRSPSLDVTNAFTIDFWMRADPGNIIGETYQGLVTSDFFGIEISMPFRRGIQVYASTNNGATWVHTIDYNGGVGALFASGEWHHIAGTYDGTKLQLYVDGQPSGNPAPMTGLISPMRPDGFLTIGSEDGRGEPGRYFKGQIDEVDIFNRALSASEIQAIYAAGGAGKCEPTGGLVINTQPASQTAYIGDSATFTVVATGQPPMSYQWRFNGVDLVEQTNSSLTIAPVQLGNAGNYSVTVADPAGSVISAAAVLTVLPREACVPPVSGMISWWSGEGDTLDRAGANSGRLVGGATFGTGHVGQAFSFNGAGQYVEMDNSPNLNPAGSFTVEAWIMPVQNSGWQVIMGKWGDESDAFNQRSYNFSMVPGGGLIFGISDEPNQWNTSLHHFITTNDVVKPNVWSHVAAVYQQSTGTRQIYVNGTMIAERRDPPISVLNSTSKVGIGARLASSTSGSDYFMGLIDEVSFYAKALSDAEIQAIYAAGSAGKCVPTGVPAINVPPVSQTAYIGDSVTFTVIAGGQSPLSYQWRFNSVDLVGQTNSSLAIAPVQLGNAGNYSVLVTNQAGSVTSTDAVLTVLPRSTNCVPPVSGMVSWWSGEGNALDRAGANPGALIGNATFGAGRVGQAFVFDGSQDAVDVGNSPSLQLQNFTIEAWIKRGSSSEVSYGSGGHGVIFGYGAGGYGLYLNSGARLVLTKIGAGGVWDSASVATITDASAYHHVAVTKNGSQVIFYIDGVGEIGTATQDIYVFNTPAGIGARIDNQDNSFMGSIDEVAVYDRPLQASEIQTIYAANTAGKCSDSIPKNPPVVQTPPVNRTALAGSTVSFTVSVSGTPPFSYQWNHNGATISGATNESLTLANVQPGQAGTYLVRITNVVGSAEASATLTVNLPTAVVRAVNTSGNAGQTLSVPIVLSANGNENGIGFSLNFYPSQLTYQDVQLGSGAAGYSLVLNTNQAAAGRVGVLVSAPFGAAFAAGSQEVVRVLFLPPVSTNSRTATLSFADQPVVRQLSDAMGNTLPSTFLSGMLSIAPSQFEGDVAMRPNGDGKVTVADWVLIGRFAAKLDDTGPANGSEFQRADCAPRSTLGDGIISVTDWVQAGRYAANLDELTLAGGPEAPKPPGQASSGAGKLNVSREIRISDATIQPGDTANVTVSLQAQGDENAVGFSLSFDPAVFAFRGANRGSSAGSATVQINTNEVGRGSVAAMLALPPGSSFEAGERELLTVSLQSIASFDGTPVFALTDVPILREVSDVNASPLPTKYVSGKLTVVPLPSLKMDLLGAAVRLSWPASAVHFTLQESGELPASSSTWTNTVEPVQSADDELFVVLPLKDSARFYRLQRFSAP